MDTRKPYPSDVSDEEWAFMAPYLALVREDAPQREYDLREVFNGLRWIVGTGSARRWSTISARAFAAFGRPGVGAHGGHTRLAHPEIHPGERPSGRLRWAQGQEGIETTRCGAHFRTLARPAREPGQRGRPPRGERALRGDPAGDRRDSRVGLCRSGIHGREGLRVRCRTRHPARSGQARGGQARLRTIAEALGGGTRFRMGIALSAVSEGLREAARDGSGVALCRLRLPLPPAGSRRPWPRACYGLERKSRRNADSTVVLVPS